MKHVKCLSCKNIINKKGELATGPELIIKKQVVVANKNVQVTANETLKKVMKFLRNIHFV